jgi:hypothetical protein
MVGKGNALSDLTHFMFHCNAESMAHLSKPELFKMIKDFKAIIERQTGQAFDCA